MQQNLPLNYPAIITKFLQDRISTDQVKQPNKPETNSLVDFDIVFFKGLEYQFDLLDDGAIICIKELNSNQIYNITKHDYPAMYKDMPDLLGLLNYIEQRTMFTVTDWVQSYTKHSPMYVGKLIDVYKLDKDFHMVRVKLEGKTCGFSVSYGKVTFTSFVEFCTSVSSFDKTAKVSISSGSIQQHKEVIESLDANNDLLHLLNTEHSISHYFPEQRGDIVPLDISFPDDITHIDLFGIVVRINHELGSLHFEWMGKNYDISTHGHLITTDISAESNRPVRPGNYGITFMRLSTCEELQLANAVVQTIKQMYEVK